MKFSRLLWRLHLAQSVRGLLGRNGRCLALRRVLRVSAFASMRGVQLLRREVNPCAPAVPSQRFRFGVGDQRFTFELDERRSDEHD